MSNYQINAIVTRALADRDFQKAILNGQRRERLQDFNLSPELEETIMSFKRGSIDQMICQLNDLSRSLTGRNNPGVSRSLHAADQGFSRAQ